MSKKYVGSVTYACKLIVQNKLYFITINWQSIVYPLGYFLIIDYMVMSFTLFNIASHLCVLLWPFNSYWHRLCPSHASLPFLLPLMLFVFYLPMGINFCLTFHWSCHYSILNLLILHLKLPNYVPLVLRGNCPFSRYVWFLNTPCSTFPL
jgi:hypothetical protein